MLWLLVVSSAAAQTEAGSTESLKVPGVNARSDGEPFTVTVEGVADGAHRLYVYGGTGEHCPIEHITEPAQEANPKKWLSSPEGEALPQGPFVKTFEAIYEEPYVVCAYLYAPPARFPDAWEDGCFATSHPEGGMIEPLNCYMQIPDPWLILGGERAAERVEQEHREALRRERELEEANRTHLEAEPDAPTSHRCHVPALHGHTLAYAKRMLHAANCSLGKITIRRRDARVHTQRPHPGSTRADGTKVSITLGD